MPRSPCKRKKPIPPEEKADVPVEFGDIVVADHLYSADSCVARKGETYGLVIFDSSEVHSVLRLLLRKQIALSNHLMILEGLCILPNGFILIVRLNSSAQ